VGSKLYLKNALGYHPLAMDDASEKKALHSLIPGQFDLQKILSSYLRTIEDHGFDDHIQEVHLGQGVLKLILEALSLKEVKEAISLVELGLEGMLHTPPQKVEM
jgi:hypothetical protein